MLLLIPVELSDTVAPTLAAVLVLLHGSASAANVVAGALEVIRMAGSAERCVSRIRPRDRTADGIAMTVGTARIPSVIAGIITPWIMSEDVRRPAGRRMTHVTLRCRIQVEARLRRGTAGGAVTFIAASGCAGIVNPGAADEGRGGVAEMTIH